MATKTTGAEFKKFYEDDSVWPDGSFHEDTVILVDGVDAKDSDFSAISDTANVCIESGWVFLPDKDDGIALGTYFNRWRKRQSLQTILVEVDADKLDAVIAAVKAAGGKVK